MGKLSVCLRSLTNRREHFCKHSFHSELVLFISVFLLLFSQRSTTNYLHYLFLQRARRRRVQFRVLHTIGHYVSIIATGTNALLVNRRAWIFPRPQNWFQSLLNNRALELWWKEDIRVSPQTYDHTDLSSSWIIPATKRVAVLKIDNCYGNVVHYIHQDS